MEAMEILKLRSLMQLQNNNKKQATKTKQQENVVTGRFLGVSSAASFNNNRIGLIQTPTGIVRTELIASGRYPQNVTAIKSKNEAFGFVPGLPAGR